jgi:MYXO-CTERM domain-containing protein
MRHHLLFSLCASFALAACGQGADGYYEGGATAFGSVSQPIVNGVSSGPEDDTAVYVHTAPDQACSGTMIAPNLVATALHCISHVSPGSFVCNPDGTLSDGSQAQGAGRMGTIAEAGDVSIIVGSNALHVEPSAYGIQLFGSGSSQICRADIGFIVLDRNLDLPITPVRLDYSVRSGDTVRVMGYGANELGNDTVRFTRSGVRVVDVGPTSDNATSISAAPRTFVVTEGPCQGDSGGPAISEETGGLVGVYSLAAGETCTAVGVRNVYTNLSSFSGLALEAFAAAGAEPILDAAPTEPEAPSAVSENACSLGSTSASGSLGTSLFAVAGLGLALSLRRRRA